MAGPAQTMMAKRRLTVKSNEDETDLDRIIETDLPQAIDQFSRCYAKVSETVDLDRVSSQLEPAMRLGQVLHHLRDVSWRTALSAVQAERVGVVFGEILPIIQAIIALAGALDVQGILKKGTSNAHLLRQILLGLNVSTFYCALAGTLGVPVTLIVEEVCVGIVSCIKQHIRQVVMPLLTASERSDHNKKGGPSTTQAGENDGKVVLALSPEESAELYGSIAATLHGLHEFLSRHRFPDEQIHQLVHMANSVFFFTEPDFKILGAAEELLVTIFGRYDHLRGSLLQEFLVKVPKLPNGKRARKFQLPVAEDSPDFGLSTWTHVLLRLAQSSCLPLHEPMGAEVDFAKVLNHRGAAQTVLSQIASGLIQRLLLMRTRDEELRSIMDELVEELMLVAFKPPWPAALALIRTFVQQLIGVVQPEKKKVAADSYVREYAMKVLSTILSRLWYHHVEAVKSHITLPPWTERPQQKSKEERLLQHLALRVSLEEDREMPWTQAAREVQAWDAELFLAPSEEEQSGLSSFTDDIVFGYLTMAHLEDERLQPARCPPSSSAPPALSAAVFPSSHPVHAWSFLVCDWAEASVRTRKHRTENGKNGENVIDLDPTATSKQTAQQAVTERFLAAAWTSRVPLCGEGSSWRCGSGQRLLLPFTVYKVYRQFRCAEFEGLRRAAFDCLVMQANAGQASLRKTAMRALSDIIDIDVAVLSLKPVEETVDMRLRDESSWVRQVSLDLLGRVLESSMGEESGDRAATPIQLNRKDQTGATASAMLLRFHQTVRGRINDTSVLVRRQASKILSAFVLNHPEHPDVVDVALDLLRRSTDSDLLRNLVLGTFELLWFMDEEPTARAAGQLARVVDASRNLGAGSSGILNELLKRFKKNISSRRHSRGFEYAIRRWTTLLLNQFVQLTCDPGQRPEKHVRMTQKEEKRRVAPCLSTDDARSEAEKAMWLQRRSLLSTLEAFAVVQPKELIPHLRPLSVYLALEDDSHSDDQWIALKVCRILSAVLPCVAERRGLMDHRQLQHDLQVLIRNQPSTGVHEAVRCLCLVVKYITGDLGQLLTHLNTAIPTLLHLCGAAEAKPGSLDRIQQMYMSRQVWILSSVLESLHIDDYVETKAESAGNTSARRFLPRASLRFDLIDGSVVLTVADLLVRLWGLQEPQLQSVAVTCLGFFVRGNRGFVKDRRICDIFSSSLSSSDLSLCLKTLETLASLLSHFGSEADRETRVGAKDFADDRDGRIAGGGAGSDTGSGEGAALFKASAVESAQPLAAYSNAILAHITLAGSIGPAAAKGGGADAWKSEILKIRVEALAVLRLLHQQGLVNPMVVLPKVFALSFTGDVSVAEPASVMLREMLELRPTLLLNRLDEAFREAFLATLSVPGAGERQSEGPQLGVGQPLVEAPQLAALVEVYVERFRRQKGTREAFLRKALTELFRLEQKDRFQERFTELMAATRKAPPAIADDCERPSGALALRQGGKRLKLTAADMKEEPRPLGRADSNSIVPAFDSLPLLQQYQLLYAQFVASALSALPFFYESEPLLVVLECNNHLSLHAGTLFADADKLGTGGEGRSSSVEPADIFTEALSILTCLVLKGVMKTEYGLKPEQCAQFNPKDPKQERLKCGFAIAGLGNSGEEMTGSVKMRFPVEKWCRLAAPLAANFTKPGEIAAYIRSLTDDDPWDHNHGRHAAVIDRLEGRRPAGAKDAASKNGRRIAPAVAQGLAAAAAAASAAPGRGARGRGRRGAAVGSRGGRGRAARSGGRLAARQAAEGTGAALQRSVQRKRPTDGTDAAEAQAVEILEDDEPEAVDEVEVVEDLDEEPEDDDDDDSDYEMP